MCLLLQKFRFCGDGDCPDWVLAEIHSTLSVLTAIKLKILTQLVIKSILGEEIPVSWFQLLWSGLLRRGVQKLIPIFIKLNIESRQEEKLQETFAKTDKAEIKSGFACIRFLLINAARYHVDEATFSAELQQLGLPAEHSNALCRVYFASDLIAYLEETNFTGWYSESLFLFSTF